MVRARLSGFTLVELLAGLALFGLMAAALFGALRTGVQTWERAELKSRQVTDARMAEDFLRRSLGAAFPLRAGDNSIAFDGDAAGLRFAGALPAHLGGGGVTLLSLGLQTRQAEAKALVLHHFAAGGTAQDSVLLEDLAEVRFDFFGRSDDNAEPAWRESWPRGTRLPALVRMRLRFAGAAHAHDWLLPVRLGEEAGCARADFQRDCAQVR